MNGSDVSFAHSSLVPMAVKSELPTISENQINVKVQNQNQTIDHVNQDTHDPLLQKSERAVTQEHKRRKHSIQSSSPEPRITLHHKNTLSHARTNYKRSPANINISQPRTVSNYQNVKISNPQTTSMKNSKKTKWQPNEPTIFEANQDKKLKKVSKGNSSINVYKSKNAPSRNNAS